MFLKHVELEDIENNDGWTNKVDIYGYENKVWVMAHGFFKEYPTRDFENTKNKIDSIIAKLKEVSFKIIYIKQY
ncbi:hypothetical protein ACTNDN_06565 [Niallia sp. HCP3S3_B10]|uniref:hypothetical protein n=1 Tax=Niallia sp. HCP3S3_B10 TaxID=3438944 RepID=UPI003F8A592F